MGDTRYPSSLDSKIGGTQVSTCLDMAPYIKMYTNHWNKNDNLFPCRNAALGGRPDLLGHSSLNVTRLNKKVIYYSCDKVVCHQLVILLWIITTEQYSTGRMYTLGLKRSYCQHCTRDSLSWIYIML